MEFVTKELRIIPLSVEQFRLMLERFDKMEDVFKLKHSKQKLDDETKAAMQELYDKAVQHEDEYVWYTNWQIILKEENVSIGSACFKGEPDENGVVEIGYGLDEKYRGKGYMTAALKIMLRWAKAMPHVKKVIALTSKENAASQKVLENCGMKFEREEGDLQYWSI